ncbi:MAG: Gfo/Idh/MocA family protein [Niastella sp.]|uniref:Gfo/Idh/MocA family protein n=1 Tax=Niastella sp. TaxID=1869183 RepID=UPI00389A9505
MKKFSRRHFLQSAGTAVGTGVIAAALPAFGTSTENKKSKYEGKKLNIALVGLGRYAGFLAEGLQEAQYCRLAGIVTGTASKAVDWKKRYNIPDANIYNYQNFDGIKNNKDIDVVYIVLPNSMHKEYAIRTAQAGKHLIVEKPMAITASDCQEMIDACKKAGVQMANGYRLHYEPYNMEMKRLGQEKVFGQVRLVEASLGYKTSDPNEWRLKKSMAGGGPLMNVGIYCVQASRYITGEEPVSVTAQFGPNTDSALFKEVEASITWQLAFPSGAYANCSSSYNCGIDRLYASADNGSFELSPAISYGPFRGKTSKGELNFPVTNQQAVQCDEIAKVLLAGKQLPSHITGEEGLKDLRIMQAIYEAAQTGKKLSLR